MPFLLFLGALGFSTLGCGLQETFFPPDERQERALDQESRLRRIDHLTKIGDLRAAVDEAERALADHPGSSILRDRLAELRSMRQVTFEKQYLEAENEFLKGHPRTALLILKEIEDYGDESMLRKASALRDEIGEVAPLPAVQIERD
jgi:hypothetical protein